MFADDILSRFLRRIRAQVKQFQHFAASLNAQREHGFMSEMPSSEEEKLTRDQFNIQKIIVAVTKAGKLFGLDSSGQCVLSLASYSLNSLLSELQYHPEVF